MEIKDPLVLEVARILEQFDIGEYWVCPHSRGRLFVYLVDLDQEHHVELADLDAFDKLRSWADAKSRGESK